MDASVKSKLREIVGAANYSDAEEDRIVYAYDGVPMIENAPEAILFPETTEQIAEIVTLANDADFAVTPRGAGTGLSGGSIPSKNAVVLATNTWNKILEIDAENMTATVQTGVVTAQLMNEVEKIGLFYPPDPGSMNVCTIGGNVAENAGGLRGLKYGVTKNYVMGLEMVTATGETLRMGGKNVKDVAGYNLKEFAIGSEGTFGVFTEILLKLVPKPQKIITMTASFDKLVDAGKAVADIIAAHVIPCTMEFLDKTTIQSVEDYAKVGLPTGAEAMLLVEVDGFGSAVEDDAEKAMAALKKNGASEVIRARDAAEADRIKTARRSAFSALARQKPTTILEDATVPRSALPEMIEACQAAARKHDLFFGNFGHAGDGNLHPTCLIDERNADEVERAHKAFDEIYDKAIALGGTITGEHGVGLAKKKFLEQVVGPVGVKTMQAIKRAIDPNDVLNPGKMFSLAPRCESPLPRTQAGVEAFEERFPAN
ncbi:MAG: FAD-binding protein [Ignavibacteriales bacterium]|nr:FAD-binding protein [Ignavibacteriales bacterium]